MENSMVVFQNSRIKLSYDPAIPLLVIFPKEFKAGTQKSAPPCSWQHYSQERKGTTPQVSINRWIGKQMHTHTMGYIIQTLKEGNSITCYNSAEPQRHDSKCNKLDKEKNTVWFHLYEPPRVVKFTQTVSRTVAARGWRGRNGELVFHGYRAEWKTKSSGDGRW